MTENSPLIANITADNLLPQVFAGMETLDVIAQSQIWLKPLSFSRGQKILIRAESGKGKSSLISFVYGRRTDYNGTISFDGKDIRSKKVADWCAFRRRSLAWLPQEMALFGELTALDNVLLKNDLTGFRTLDWIKRAFTLLEIDNRIDRPAEILSVGQQQRVAIIRSLCQPMDFLLLDEPVSHLDPRTNKLVASLVSETLADTGAALIATSVGNNLDIDFDKEYIL